MQANPNTCARLSQTRLTDSNPEFLPKTALRSPGTLLEERRMCKEGISGVLIISIHIGDTLQEW